MNGILKFGRALLALALLSCLASCATTNVRTGILMPTAETAFGSIKSDLVRGIADGVEDGDIDESKAGGLRGAVDALEDALRSRDVERIRAEGGAWIELKGWAIRGVQDRVEDGELSPGVATSFLERILNFGLVLDDLRAAMVDPDARPRYHESVRERNDLLDKRGAHYLTFHNYVRSRLGADLLEPESCPEYFLWQDEDHPFGRGGKPTFPTATTVRR